MYRSHSSPDDEPPPPPGSSPEVVEAYRQRRLLRRAGRGPQYGDAMIGPVEELQLNEETRPQGGPPPGGKRRTRMGQMQQAR